MIFYKTILFTLLYFMLCPFAKAQTIERFNTFSYSVNEGLLQSTMAQIEFDGNNFCWISFPNGIQKFDGSHFVSVTVQPGLPDDKFVRFFRCSNGSFLISHAKGISSYNVDNNRFTLVYENEPGVKKAVRFIGEDENRIYFFSENSDITGISNHTFKVVSHAKTSLPNYAQGSDYAPKLSNNIVDHKTAIQIKSCLYLWDLKNARLVAQSDSIPYISAFFLMMKTGTEVLYYTYAINNALQLYNFKDKTSSILYIKGKDLGYISRCIIYPWQNKALIGFSNRIYELDTALLELKAELVNFQNKPVTGNMGISDIKADNFGNLFIQTINGGIKKIIHNNYPLKYYGTEKKDSNYILSVLPDKKSNRVLAGTSGNGLLIFDTLQRLVKHIKMLPGKNGSFSVNAIVKDPKGNYLLFPTGSKNVWRLSQNLSGLSSIEIESLLPGQDMRTDYFGNVLFQDEKQAIVQSQGKIYRVIFANNRVTGDIFTNSYTMGGLSYNTAIISHANDELIFLETSTFSLQKKISFKNTGYVRCLARDAAGNIYLGSNKGIFKIDSNGKILMHITTAGGLPDECIYAMVFDDKGFLWCSTNKGIFKLNKDNSIFQLTKDDGLQENEFNTNVVAKSDDGEIFFGGVNGVSSFYPAAISSFEEKINLLVTGIKINNEEAFKDTAVWNIKKIVLPYHQNSLAFDFIAMANNNPGQYIYQYQMEGIDRSWIQNSGLQTVRYFLPPGEYVFKLYASRFFDKDAKPMKEIRIIINPPLWKTWWFITAAIVLGLVALAYAFNRYNKNRYQEKLAVLENEHRIQLERERISRDLHDSIGAYANAVLYNTELLQKETGNSEKNALMNDLKFASKDIITSLRETVWALKKDNYSAEDCWLRIKNFMQALSRYYPLIHFKIEGEAAAEKQLHHTKALNVVRIVQEAVTNAIKHAATASITLSSSTNEGKWQLTVEDDGRGFDHEAVRLTESGNGLLNMQQRATDSGFELTVNSIPGNGTLISVRV